MLWNVCISFHVTLEFALIVELRFTNLTGMLDVISMLSEILQFLSSVFFPSNALSIVTTELSYLTFLVAPKS